MAKLVNAYDNNELFFEGSVEDCKKEVSVLAQKYNYGIYRYWKDLDCMEYFDIGDVVLTILYV